MDPPRLCGFVGLAGNPIPDAKGTTMGRDDEQVWAELVQSFHASDEDARWPAAEDIDPDDDAEEDVDSDDADSHVTTTRPAVAGLSPSMPAPEAEPARPVPDDEHFVPPTPPPLPRTDLITMLAWVGVLGTPFLFIVLVLFGRTLSGLPGLAAAGAFIGGFAVLVTRLRGHDPRGPDNGAVV
jgi:hypothetical protein